MADAQPPSPQAADRTAENGPDQQWRLLADALPVLVSFLERDGEEVRYRFVNRLYETWFPLTRTEIIGRTVREVVGEAAYGAVETYVRRALAGERLTFEAMMPYKDAPARQVRIEYVPRRSSEGVDGIYTLVEDVTEARQIQAALRESEEDYRYAAELNPQVAWTAQPDGQLDRVAARWREWTGSSGLGSSYADSLHPDDVARTLEDWGASVATGASYDVVHRVQHLDGAFRWIRSRAYPRRDATGAIVRWYGATEDIHEQKKAEDHLRLLVLELNHRVKNNLATVQAIAMQTLRGPGNAAEARHALLERLAALASAHDILTREKWEGASMEDVAHGVLDSLAPSPGRIGMRGAPTRLGSQAALAIAMALHELGTNALKYGALSNAVGTVHLSWSGGSGEPLAITWTELGGPEVSVPTHRGFGTRLLKQGVARELNAIVGLDFKPQGLVCTIAAAMAPAGSALAASR